MKQVNDEFIKRFKDKELKNDGFDSDGLWDSISKNMDSKISPELKSTSRGIHLTALAIVLSAGIAIGLFFTFYSDSVVANVDHSEQIKFNKTNTNINPIHIDFNQENSSVNRIDESLEKTNELNPIYKTKVKNKVSGNANISNQKSFIASQKNNTIPKEEESKNQNVSTHFDQSTVDKQALTLRTLNNNFDTSQKTIAVFQKDQIASSSITSKSDILEERNNEQNQFLLNSSNNQLIPKNGTLISRPLLSIIQLPSNGVGIIFNRNVLKTDTMQTYRSMLQKQTLNDKLKFELGLTTGINWIQFNYDSKIAPELSNILNQSLLAEQGYNFGINTTATWKNWLSINSGINYTQNWSKLDYTKKDSIEVLKENQLIKVWVDSENGDTLNSQIGNVFVDAISTRRVVHFNQFRTLNIPLEIGIIKQYEKFNVGFSAGTYFSFRLSQKGRLVNDNFDVIDFNTNDELAPLKSFSIGLSLRPVFAYKLNQKIALKLEPQFVWILPSSPNGNEGSLTTRQTNINLGMYYGLN